MFYQPGDRIAGRFLVHRPLGAETYQCLDGDDPYLLRKQKTELPDSWTALETHPHVVRCFGAVDNMAIIEWVYGAAWLPDDAAEHQKWTWAIDVCRGLLHIGQLVPQRILIDQHGLARLTDFVSGVPTIEIIQRILPDEDLPATLKDVLLWLQEQFHEKFGSDTPQRPLAEAMNCDNLGCIYHEVSRLGKALSLFNRALALEPSWSVLYCHRGAIYRDMELYDAGLMDFQRAIELDPNDARAYNGRGELYNAMGQPEAALAEFDLALQYEPTLVQALNNRGNTYSALGRHDLALVDLNRALALDPQCAKVYANRGSTYQALGHYEAALVDYDQALVLDPWLVPVYTNRGNVFAALGDSERGLAEHQRALDMAPNFAEAHYNIGVLLANRDQYEEALVWLQRALELGFAFAQHAITHIENSEE